MTAQEFLAGKNVHSLDTKKRTKEVFEWMEEYANQKMIEKNRAYTRDELVEHWKFCEIIFKMVKNKNGESTNSAEREATKFTCECIVEIMDDLNTLIESEKP